MAKCKECNKEFGIFELKGRKCKSCILKETPKCAGCGNLFKKELLTNGYCHPCNLKEQELLKREKERIRLEQERIRKETRVKEFENQSLDELRKIILTTETVVDFKIDKRLDIITAECAIGMNIFKDILTGVRDAVGGRSNTLQNTLRESKNIVLNELKKEAYSLGANAVVGVDLDYSEFSGGGKSMFFIVASGTAVVISEK